MGDSSLSQPINPTPSRAQETTVSVHSVNHGAVDPNLGNQPPPGLLRPKDVADGDLIYECNQYIIWVERPSLNVMWKTADCFDPIFQELQKQKAWAEVIGKQTELEALPLQDLPQFVKEGFRYQIGSAILFLFIQNFEQSQKAMVNAETFYRSKIAERARLWILLAGVVAICLATVAAFGGGLPAIFQQERMSLLARLEVGGFAAIWGTFISLASRASTLGIDATAGKVLHFLEAGCRMLTGIAAGALVICALEAKLVAPSLLTLGSPVILLLGFVAGFSERLLPSLVGKVESSATSGANRSNEKPHQ